MSENNKITIAIISCMFFPGIGHLIYGKNTKGAVLLLGTIFCTIFYFIPFFVYLLPGETNYSLFLFSIIVALLFWIVDVGLMIYAILDLLKISKKI